MTRRRRVGAYALGTRGVGRELELLLTRCSPQSRWPGLWTLPGGGIEWGEHPRDALVRELREETGVDAALGPLLATPDVTVPASGDWPSGTMVGLIYSVRFADTEPRVADGDVTADAAAWHRLDDLPALGWNGAIAAELVAAGVRSHPPEGDVEAPAEIPAARPDPSRRRLAGYGIVRHADDRDRILLTRLAADEPEAGKWTLPGGGVDPDEAIVAAFRREVLEEADVVVDRVGLVGVVSQRLAPWGDLPAKHNIGVIHRAEAVGTPRVVEVDGSTCDARWFPVDAVRDLDLSELASEALRRWTELGR